MKTFVLGATILVLTLTSQIKAEITFSKEVVRMLQEHCQACHRDDGVGPFPLLHYDDALPRARAIKSAVVSRRMPHGASVRLDTGCTKPDTFEGRRRLTWDEIETIVQWVDSGAPEGDPADLPTDMTFADGVWKSGQPDVIIPVPPAGFSVPARLGRDIFRRFPIRTYFGAAVYLTGFEALAGSGDHGGDHLHRIVHHVTLWIDPDCNSIEQERVFAVSNPEVPGPGFEGPGPFAYPVVPVGFWAPGSKGIQLPQGVGIKVPANSCLIAEVHYATYHESAVLDNTVLGLKIAAGEMRGERINFVLQNKEFFIPAGESHFPVEARKTLIQDATILSIQPHSHQLGTDFLTYAILPNGEKTCLMDVEWDFTHQDTYNYREPVQLPAGTEVISTCWYDNTESNPHQFNHPPIGITNGPSSNREMCEVDIGLVYKSPQQSR